MENNVKYYPLTHPQKGIWYTEKLYPGTCIGNIAATLKIKDLFVYELLDQAINLLIQNNDSLRLRFTEKDGEPKQYLCAYKYEKIDYFDFSNDGLEPLYNWDTLQTQTPFNLIDTCLYYFAIIKISDKEFGFYSKMHHLISDGWSIVQTGNKILENYYKIESGVEKEQSIFRSYLDFINTEKTYKETERFQKDKEYWESHFNQEIELTSIKINTNNHDLRAKRKTFVVPVKFSTKIRQFCKDNNTSIFSLFITALCIYINRITLKDDIIIGVPVLNRTNSKEKDTLGMFVSTVPLRVKIKEEMNFKEFLDEMTNQWFSALRHQKYPFDLILKNIRENNRNIDKLYDISLSYQNAKFVKSGDTSKQEGRWHFNGYQSESLYIHINDREDDGNIILDFDYNCILFKVKEIEFIYDHITRLLWHALDNPIKKIPYIEMISEKEKHKILYEFNDTLASYPKEKTINLLFEEQVERTPDNIALVFENKTITYFELNQKSNQLARHLLEIGVKRNMVVGIVINRSIDMIISILAIHKSGGAYLPIDPDYPKNRIGYMLEDSKTRLLLTQQNKYNDLNIDGRIVNVNDSSIYNNDSSNINLSQNSKDLAYLIYTSGSTGNPKGVMIEHRSLINFCFGILKKIDFFTYKTILSLTTMCFDIFFLESLLPLLTGMKVVIANEEQQKNPELICNILSEHNVNIIQSTPSRMQSIISNSKFDTLSHITEILIGGESFPESLFNKLKLKTNARIYNMYGPTETTIWSTIKDLTECKKIDIGKPIINTQIYILDKELNLLPIGVIGELYIGGDCLARGYLDRQEYTNQKFIKNPFKQGELIYKTGDIARWYPGGDIEYIGRIDNQVKIRGYRIELGEIESRLLNIDCINECVVIDRKRDDGSSYLCAYIVCDEIFNEKKIKNALQKYLPSFMIPSYFTKLDMIPKTPNGKIDRNALPIPKYKATTKTPSESLILQTKLEKDLINIWCMLLGIDDVDINSNFFDIGGDSLLAINLISYLHKELNVLLSISALFENPTISDLSSYIKVLKANTQDSIIPLSNLDYYPVSSSQKRLYLLDSIEGANVAYNMPALFKIEGQIDKKRFQNAFDKLLKYHEILRTSFKFIDETPVQIVNQNLVFNLEFVDIQESMFQGYIKQFVRTFDLSQPPLFRASVISFNTQVHFLLCDFHHIIADGHSISILYRDFLALYEGKELSECKIQYKDFSAWQKKLLEENYYSKRKKYWLKNFAGEIPVLDLPYDYQRPMIKSFKGDSIKFTINEKLTSRIKNLAQSKECTLFMVLFASYNVLLHKYTAQEDIVVGTPFIGRNHSDLNNIVGMFVNTLAIRSNPIGFNSFDKFLYEIKENCINAYDNQEYPFDELIGNLNLKRDLSRNPLFDTLFAMKNFKLEEKEVNGIKLTPIEIEKKISKFDLFMEVTEFKESIEVTIEYCSDLFKKDTIERLCKQYLKILESVTENPMITISNIDLLNFDDKFEILEFNNNKRSYPLNKTINQLFEEQVQRWPEKVAIIYNKKQITYRQLNSKANYIANILRSNGVTKGSIVGIIMPRSSDYIVGTLGILKAGGAYLPIDAEYPLERIKYMVQNSKINVLITNKKCELPYFKGMIINIKSELENEVDSKNLDIINDTSDLVYAIYTSGSTGKPKAVLIEHRNIINLVYFEYSTAKINFSDKVLQFASVSFDVCAQEIFSTLLSGGELHIINDDAKKDVLKLFEFLNESNINIIFMPPSYFKQIMSDEINISKMPNSIKHIILAGEQLIITDIMKKYINQKHVCLHNHYGPSETHVATTYTIMPNVDIPTLPPIGKPISNTNIYILDKNNFLQPIGVPGELYIAGDCVGRGYLNNKELTNGKYITDLFGEVKMYRTGDLARWLPDGNIEFLGRLDNQVKIRGYRIELGEIENHISNYKGIKEAAVNAVSDLSNNKYLCAYYVSDYKINNNTLKNYLIKHLPLYMIPQHIIQLDKIPKTPSGKIDRKLLQEPKYEIYTKKKHNIPPQNDTQKTMLCLWEEVLNIKNIGINDNFFELGGDSLSLIKLQIKALNFNWNLTTQDYYNLQTIKELSEKIDGTLVKNYKEEDYTINSINYNFRKSKAKNLKNYLLIGSTGFLGAHLLNELLSYNYKHIYCIVRGENMVDAKQYLLNKLSFYFGNDNAKNMCEKITVINGDISKIRFNLNETEYNFLGNNVDILINSAAIVKHYGNYNEFKEVNILGTDNIAKFCIENNIMLNHMSTIGISGNNYNFDKKNEICKFSENDLDIGQSSINNVYIRSKFQAEGILQNYAKKGLTHNIFRIGNLTGRYSDGLFQENILENAFYNRIKSIIEIGYIQNDYLNVNLDFTPVDICSNAIIKIISSKKLKNNTYHLFNHNLLSTKDFINFIGIYGFNIEFIDKDTFLSLIKKISSDKKSSHILTGIIQDINNNMEFNFENQLKITSDITQDILLKLDFIWPIIDYTYVKKILDYMCDNINFIKNMPNTSVV